MVALGVALLALGCSDDDDNDDPTSTSTSGPGAGGSGATGGSGGSGPGAGGSGATGGIGGAGGTPVPQNQFLYVANQNDDTVSVYVIEDDGELSFVENEPILAQRPGPLAVNPNESRLYVASVSGRAVSAFDIDPATGELDAIGSPVSINPTPVYITVDQTGGYLLLASYGGDVAESYALNGDGTLDGTAISSHAGPGDNPHAIVLSPNNDFAFVPNTNPTPETISQFVFNPTDGTLTDNPTAATVDASGAIPVGPRHLTFHPTLDLLYVVNEHSDSVTVYDFNPVSGTLTEGATTSTLPGGQPSGGNTCADIHITPDGNALYASNRGDNSLAMFSVDNAGALAPIGHVATELIPREFEITRDGRFVFAANQDSNTLNAYVVGTDGTLTPGPTPLYAVGDRPMWVLAISVDQP